MERNFGCGGLQPSEFASFAFPLPTTASYYFALRPSWHKIRDPLDAKTLVSRTGASGSHGFFCADKNGPILIGVPGLCPSAFVGDVKPVTCGTNEPYVEPKDLAELPQLCE